MNTYEILFSVDGHRSETIIRANSTSAAKDILKAQYPNSKITIYRCTKVR